MAAVLNGSALATVYDAPLIEYYAQLHPQLEVSQGLLTVIQWRMPSLISLVSCVCAGDREANEQAELRYSSQPARPGSSLGAEH